MKARFPRPDLRGGDERNALPSASDYDRLSACSPSFAHSLLVEVTQAEQIQSGALQGTLNHRYLATGQRTGVQAGDLDALDALKRRALRFTEAAFAREGVFPGEQWVEERLWIWRDPLGRHGSAAPEFVGSGKADGVWLSSDRRVAVVNEYKTLWGHHKQAPQSGQIYALAGILKANVPGLQVVYGGVHSRANPHTTPARFSRGVLEGVAEDVAATFEAAIVQGHDDEQAKRAGSECGFCPAASVCPTYAASLEASLTEVKRLTQKTEITNMSLEDLERLLRHKGELDVARKVMDQAEQRALHLIEEKGQRSPALDVVPGRKYTRLDPALLYRSLVAQYPQRQGEIDAFWRQHGTVSVDEARKLTGTLLQTDLNQFQGKGVEVLQRAPSLRLKR